jgi:hypothetical protein
VVHDQAKAWAEDLMDERIESTQQYTDTPEGWARRWTVEITASKKALEKWRDPGGRGDKVIDRYLDERGTESTCKRLNLFHGDVQTKRALLYGNPPRVRCRRRHADADDDEARVSAEMLERILNTDIDRDGDGFVESLGLARDDRLLPGLGQVRSRYVVEWQDVPPSNRRRRTLTATCSPKRSPPASARGTRTWRRATFTGKTSCGRCAESGRRSTGSHS